MIYLTTYTDNEDKKTAFSSRCITDSTFQNPMAGIININNAIVSALDTYSAFIFIMQQVTHILGFSVDDYARYIDEDKEPLGVENVYTTQILRGVERYLIILPTVV